MDTDTGTAMDMPLTARPDAKYPANRGDARRNTFDLGSVTAVTVSYNDAQTLAACTASLQESGMSSVVVWDNSTDRAAARNIAGLAGGGLAVYRDGTNHGFGGGNNRAVDHVTTPYVLLVNPDCVVTSEAISSMLELVESSDEIGIVAPRMRYPNGTAGFAGGGSPSLTKEVLAATGIDEILPSRVADGLRSLLRLGSRILGRKAGLFASVVPAKPLDMHWVSGFCMLMSVAVFREVNGFDERFFLYFEDVDFCERVAATGRRVILDRRVEVTHAESTSTGQAGKSRHYWTGLATYYEKNGSHLKALVANFIAARKGAS